ncbi:MAG TPA: MFS transporter [Actinocrinis sp.]|nr:MFS transporter [Actinocrinis sp.]
MTTRPEADQSTDSHAGPAAPGYQTTDPTCAVTRPWWIVAVAVVGQMLVLLDNTILNIAVQTLSDPVRGLGADSGALAWSVSAYSLVFAAAVLAGGALTDRIGPRATLIAGLTTVAVFSLVAALSGTVTELIIARGCMGAGGALVTPATLAVVTRSSTPENRPRAIAVWASSGGIAVAIGPVLGGLLLTRFWWGSVFLINLPIAAVCLLGTLALIPRLPAAGRRPLDPAGLMLSALGMGAVVYGAIEIGQGSDRAAPSGAPTVVIGLVLLAGFVWWQRRSRTPSFDVRLFALPRFTGGSVGLLLAFFGLAGQLYYCAFYLQGILGLSPLAAGGVMVAAAVGIIPGNQLSPTLVRRIGARWTIAGALTGAALTFAGYLLFGARPELGWFALMLLIQGLSVGVLLPPVTGEMMAALPPETAGAGAALNSATRPVGSTLGVAVLGSVLTAGYRTALRPALLAQPGLSPDQQATAAGSLAGAHTVAAATGRPALARAADQAYLHAMHGTSIWTAALTLIGAAVVLTGFRTPKRTE